MSKTLKSGISCISRQNTTHVTCFNQKKKQKNKKANKQKHVHVMF